MGTRAHTVEAAIESVGKWRAEEEERNDSDLSDVEQEMDSLRTAIANLTDQLEALELFKVEVATRAQGLQRQGVVKVYDGIFEALGVQAASLSERAAAVAAAEAEREASLPASLEQSEVAGLVEEFEQFKATRDSLGSLPESYRSVIVHHHQQVIAKLRDHINALMAGPVEVEGDPVTIEVVYAIDAPEGTPELLVMVLPVGEETHSDWRGRDDDLQSWLAARVVQAVYEASAEAHHPVQAMCGGHRGLLAIEVDLLGAPAELADSFKKKVSEVLGAAPELKAAHLKVSAREVSIDFLLPPEDDTDGGLDDMSPSRASDDGAMETADAG